MFLISKFVQNMEDDPAYYEVTDFGLLIIIIAILVSILAAAVIVARKQKAGGFTSKKLTVAAIALALGFITSYIKIEMPMGGSITLFSMFFICYIGYLYGIYAGLVTAFAYGLLQLLQSGGSYILTPFQVCCDYIFAFTALGITGFWYRKKKGFLFGRWKLDENGKEIVKYSKENPLITGYVVACLVRGLFHTLGGYIYWMDFMPESFPKGLASLYSIIYNYSYILAEMILTLIVISLPPVKAALKRIKNMVSED